MGSGKIICAVLTAAAVGAAVGLLFTEKGKELRSKLADKLSDLESEGINTLKDKINDFTGKDILDSGTSKEPM